MQPFSAIGPHFRPHTMVEPFWKNEFEEKHKKNIFRLTQFTFTAPIQLKYTCTGTKEQYALFIIILAEKLLRRDVFSFLKLGLILINTKIVSSKHE